MHGRIRFVGCIFSVIVWMTIPGAGQAAGVENGPQEMRLKTEKDAASPPKEAVFPHARHQAYIACGTCHHTRKEGEKRPYTAGMTIGKCEECHYAGSSMPSKDDAAQGIVRLDSYQSAGHALCRTCHDATAKKNPAIAAKWRGCLPCHS